MRDPKRINEITLALADCWSNFPDMRFGQLVSNIHHTYHGGDMFFPEDDLWLNWIKKFKEDFAIKYV